MKRLIVPIFALLVCLAALGGEAIAGILWTADWTPGTSTVISDGGKNKILFSNQAPIVGEDNSDITASNITVQTPVVDPPDTFTAQNYSLVLKLTDNSSGKSSNFTFSGALDGTIAAGSANIDNTFNDPQVQMAVIGDNEYTVTIGPYTPPPVPGGIPGSISAHIDVVPSGGEEPPNETPEPSSLLLASLGVTGLGLWRKRRLLMG